MNASTKICLSALNACFMQCDQGLPIVSPEILGARQALTFGSGIRSFGQDKSRSLKAERNRTALTAIRSKGLASWAFNFMEGLQGCFRAFRLAACRHKIWARFAYHLAPSTLSSAPRSEQSGSQQQQHNKIQTEEDCGCLSFHRVQSVSAQSGR